MARQHNIELMVGAFVALGLLALFFLVMKVSNLTQESLGDTYYLAANFENVGGLRVNAPVRMAGVRVGRVDSIRIDEATYQAQVGMRIKADMANIPDDTFANIYTAGLLGAQYIGLEPGASPEMLRDGDTIFQTQSALVLEQMIGQFLFKKASDGGS